MIGNALQGKYILPGCKHTHYTDKAWSECVLNGDTVVIKQLLFFLYEIWRLWILVNRQAFVHRIPMRGWIDWNRILMFASIKNNAFIINLWCNFIFLLNSIVVMYRFLEVLSPLCNQILALLNCRIISTLLLQLFVLQSVIWSSFLAQSV